MYSGALRKKHKRSFCSKVFRKIWVYINICMGISSVHGLNHIVTKKTLAEKLLWVLLVIAAASGYIFLAHGTWHRYQVNPTVISIEVDQQNWELRFLSMTICPGIMSWTVDKVLRNMNLNKNETKEFKDFLLALYTPKSFAAFAAIPDSNLLRPEDYLDMLLNITDDFHPEISATFLRIGQLRKVVTEMGICYTYNSELSIYSSPEYWQENRWDLVDTSNETILVTSLMGTLSTTISNFDHEFYTYFHSYNDVIDVVTPKIYTKSMGLTQFQLNMMSLWTTEDVINLVPSQRQCRLPHESNLRHSPVYSYTLCRKECRIELCLKFCNCIPYFYRSLENEKICDPSGMRCLGNYTEILEKLHNQKENTDLCKTCLPNCDEDRSFTEKYDTGDWLFGSSLEWRISKFPKIRYQRELIFGLTDVLIYVGGMAGLFLGCGVLSFVEIFYFLTLKLYWFIYSSSVAQRSKSSIPKRKKTNNALK